MKAYIWVHKRHTDYPAIQVGFRLVDSDIAVRMIADGCAQDKGTDSRRLKYPTTEVHAAKKPVEQKPATESIEDEAPAPPKPKRRTYKRRDVTAET